MVDQFSEVEVFGSSGKTLTPTPAPEATTATETSSKEQSTLSKKTLNYK